MLRKKGLSEEKRLDLALRILARRQSVAALCRSFGVSRKTAYVYVQRFRARGKIGLIFGQRGRPRSSGVLCQKWRGRVCLMRRARPSWGARKLCWWLRQKYPQQKLPSRRTVQRWLLHFGLVKRKRRRLKAGCGLSALVQPTGPNMIWTFDFKGDFVTQDGVRVIALTVRDMYSRFIFAVQPMKQLSDLAVRQACVKLFKKHGMPRAIRVDKGSPFCGSGPYGLTSLSLWWTRLGVEVQFVDRKNGIDNNAHEQMHRMLKADALTPVSANLGAQQRRIRRWLVRYNQARPHQGVDDQMPASLYKKSEIELPNLAPPKYPASWLTRRVRPHGWVKLHGSHHHIGRAFEDLVVGFRPNGNEMEVYFDQLLLGTLKSKEHRSGLIPLHTVRRGRELRPLPQTLPSSVATF